MREPTKKRMTSKARKRSGRSPPKIEEPSVSGEALGLVVDRIGTVGITDHGDEFGMELTFVSGEQAVLMFPQKYFQALMSALMAAGAAAYSAQIARLGSEENVLISAGPRPFTPSDFELGRGRDTQGKDAFVIRLKKDRLPVVDFALTFPEAKRLADEITHELAKGRAPPKAVH